MHRGLVAAVVTVLAVGLLTGAAVTTPPIAAATPAVEPPNESLISASPAATTADPPAPLTTTPTDTAAGDATDKRSIRDETTSDQSTGDQTVVAQLPAPPQRPTPPVGTQARSSAVSTMQSHAAATRQPLERFAEGNPHVSIDRRLWLTNAMIVTVNTTHMPVTRLGTIDHVGRIHENYQVSVTTPTTPQATTQPATAPPRAMASPVATTPRVPAETTRMRPTQVMRSPTPTTVDQTAATAAETATTTAADDRRFTNALRLIDVPTAWQRFDTRGDGVRVAVLDTGVNPDHPDIDIQEENWVCYVDCRNGPHDVDGHGTHVSGTVVGGNANDAGLQIGVAPEATLMHAKVLNSAGSGTYGSIVSGMQWAVENDADVISASLGAAGLNNALIDPVRNAQDSGVIVVAAVGNGGSGTSSSPGNVYDATAVGAVDVQLGYPAPERSTLDLTNDTVSPFSGGEVIDSADWKETYNDTPDSWPDRYVVPDVTAPGNRIWSADTQLDTRSVSNVDTTDLTLLKGTSMATPHVAGVIALMESNSAIDRSPSELRTGLKTTAVDIGAPEQRQGTGRVDADGAVAAVATSPTITATITATPNRVTAGRVLTITYSATNSGTETGTTTLGLRRNGTVVATGETEPIAPGEQTTGTLSYQTTTADIGPQTITLNADNTTNSRTVRIVKPQVELTNVSITPSQVSETKRNHTLTMTIRNVSDDGHPDTVTIAMPEGVVVDEVTTATASDTDGNSITSIGATAITDSAISVTLSPDSSTAIRDVTVTTEFRAHQTGRKTT